ncbi:hypothetical protein CDAR_8141 [Caerostris darwini]|uniref:Uncharacterized protein n=1 Tax=Caerostris darwini TaxID=1538125 RepID=A0AAV4SZG0_9ARAC|nr:hypothetical protein CDAR_8141 [Caerostris darwini]
MGREENPFKRLVFQPRSKCVPSPPKRPVWSAFTDVATVLPELHHHYNKQNQKVPQNIDFLVTVQMQKVFWDLVTSFGERSTTSVKSLFGNRGESAFLRTRNSKATHSEDAEWRVREGGSTRQVQPIGCIF